MKITALIFIGLLSTTELFSQSGDDFVQDIKKVVPPSPDAAALGKYGEIPVSLNSGTPNISIPLYTIQGNDLSLPISLSYQGTGFRVSEVSSWVGLGWVLNAGGVITRTVRGWPDDISGGYFAMYNYYEQNVVGIPCDNFPNHPGCAWRMKASNGEVDLEPDEFSFNFNGYSGRIMFNQDKQPVLFPYQDLKIDPPWTTPNDNEWIITTPDGTVYYFDETENTHFRYGGDYTSAWYLTRIASPRSCEQILFSYASNGNQWHEEFSNMPPSVDLTPVDQLSQPKYNACSYGQYQKDLESTVTKYLTGISFPQYNLSIVLSVSDDRQDVGGESTEMRLTGLQVIKDGTRQLASYTFNNNAYFTGSTAYTYGLSYMNKRLKLVSLHDNLKNTDYFFEYYENYHMPSYESPDIDHWGFYNAAGNSSIIPNSLDPGSRLLYEASPWTTANRETNPLATKACMLTKITYPTDGYTQFTWEPHIKSFDNEVVPVVKSASVTCNNGTIAMSTTESNLASYMATLYIDDASMPINVKITPFIVANGANVAFSINETLPVQGYCKSYIYKSPTNFLYKNGILIANISPYNVFNTCFTSQCRLVDGRSMYLVAGSYALITVVTKNVSGNVSANASVTYSENEIVPFKTAYVGGVRIKEIRSHDGISDANDIIKTYVYRNDYTTPLPADAPAGYERSSITLFTNPWGTGGYNYLDACSGKLIMTSFLVDHYGIPIRSDGSHVGYSEVAEVSQGKETGVKVTKFRNEGVPEYRGQVFGEYYYDKVMKPVKSVVNKYSDDRCYLQGVNIYHRIIKVTQADVTWVIDPWSGVNIYTYTFGYYEPSPVSNTSCWLGITKSTDRIYSILDTSSYVENTTNYYYDGAENNLHSFLTRKTNTASDGSVITIKYKYPLDFTTSSNIVNTMVQRHIINLPVEQQMWKGTGLVDADYFKYYLFGGAIQTSGIYHIETNQPYTTFTGLNATGDLDANTQYKKLLTFDYDNCGHLKLQQKTDDIPMAYIWGYNQSYPVIEAKGVDNITLQNAVNSIQGNLETFITSTTIGNLTTDNQKQAWKTFNENLRSSTALKNALITTYTYDPLIGVTSVTDEKNMTTYYEYDTAGRLKLIRDFKGNILKTYDYHYAGQTQ